MAWTAPSIAAFKTFFERDIAFAPDSDASNLEYVTDTDIQKAFNEALINFNASLGWDQTIVAPATQSGADIAFFYLAAFYLAWNIQNSTKGLGAQFNFPVQGKSIGGVSINFAVPEAFTKHPYLSMLTQNAFGMKYLSLAYPFTVGRVGVVEGTTTYG